MDKPVLHANIILYMLMFISLMGWGQAELFMKAVLGGFKLISFH